MKPRRASLIWTATVLALLPAAIGCGDDDTTTTPTTAGKPKPRDAGETGPMVIPDAGARAPEHELRSGDTYLCGYDDDDALVLTGSTTFGEVAIATDDRGFALVHHDVDGSLQIEAVPIGEDPQPSVRLIDRADAPGHAALAAANNRFALLVRSGTNLLARVLVPDAAPVTLSERLAPAEDDGERFALAAQGDRFVAVWSEERGGGLAVFVRAFGLDAAPLGDALELPVIGPRGPRDLQLARLDGGRMLVAWHEAGDDGLGHVMAQPLSTALEPEHDPVQLSKNAVPEARFDLGARQLSAGVVYQAREGGVRDTVKYRRIDPQGHVSQPELTLAAAPRRARDGAIAPFGQGYAVAYRLLPSLGVEETTLHIAFINQYGRVVHEADLAPTSEDGGRTSVSASEDGHLLVGWTTVDAAGTAATHAYRLDCPGALVLCGGGML